MLLSVRTVECLSGETDACGAKEYERGGEGEEESSNARFCSCASADRPRKEIVSSLEEKERKGSNRVGEMRARV